MIRALLEYYEHLLSSGLVKEQFGWVETAVPLILDLDRDGKVISLKSAVYTTKNEKGKDIKVTPREMLPYHPVRSSNIQGFLFSDKADYVFGLGERGDKQFAAMGVLHHKVLDGVNSPIATAVLKYFDTWEPAAAEKVLTKEQLELLEDPGGFILLQVEGVKLSDDIACVTAYNEYIKGVGISGSTVTGLDIITGEIGPICRVHPKIKGIRAASAGAPVCTVNNSSCIHATGREQGYGTPVTELNAYRYSTALEYLTHSRAHNFYDRYSNTNIICWSTECEEAQQAAMLYALNGTLPDDDDASANKATEYLKMLYMGIDIPPDGFDPSAKMHIVGLDSRDGYIIRQRFYFEGAFKELMSGLVAHYQNTRIGKMSGVPFYSIYHEICRKKSDGTPIEDKNGLTASIVNNLLAGDKYPEQMLDLMLWKIQDDTQANEDYLLNRRQAGFLKACLITNAKEDIGEMLDTQNTEIGYLCGRIFASAVNIERASKSGEQTRRTMAQKIGEAMRHPADFFPMMHSDLATAYLRKLYTHGRTTGLASVMEKELGELISMLPPEGYPKRLNRTQQASFCIGYYQQRDKYIRDAQERKSEKEANGETTNNNNEEAA